MWSVNSILEEYKRSNLEKRLNLFLECPSLRTRFIEIDQGETAKEPLHRTSSEEGAADSVSG
jgi:hypothetical protein